MDALYGKSGEVYAWLDSESGRILNPNGDDLAILDGDSVYDRNGRHVAWWTDGHIRDHDGHIAVFTSSATNLGVQRPLKTLKPMEPLKSLPSLKPLKEFKPLRPFHQTGWSKTMPF